MAVTPGLSVVIPPEGAAMEATDSMLSDSVAPDTVFFHGLDYGIIMEKPAAELGMPLGNRDSGISWILSGLFLLFVVAALRYRKNSRFFSLMFHDIIDVRERHNAFDDTLRETSFVWLLNLLWCASAGILFYGFLCHGEAGMPAGKAEIARLWICIGMATLYTLFLTAAYAVVGNLFSDAGKASLWVKGFLSTRGLESIMLFPVALLALCLPEISGTALVIAGIIFILAKFLFIYKGFCIFFTQIASWVLFLYYLCSLEIVPIVLTYVSTRYLCTLI